MIFRLSANVIIEASWETPDGERHELAQWQAREPWWTQKLFALELPRAAEGKVQLRAAPTTDGTDAGTLELSFAEVVRGPQGRCYHDRVAAVSPPVSLREAHVCLAPVEAELALSTEQAKTLRVNFSQTGSGGSLVVSATGPSQSTELLRLQGENPLIWNEAIAALPSSGSRPDRIRFSLRSADPTSFFAWNTEWVVPRQPSTPPNVLVYLVDTLRADALEPYDPSQSTPGFAALARAGIVFEDVLSPTSWTLPAVASLLSGRSIRGHGVETANDVLPAQITTLAEHFRRAGFRTAAASANEFVTDKSGLEQGFEVFAVFAGRVVNGRSSAGMNDFAVPWIEAHRDEPFFLYLHVVDPHQPYLTDPSIESSFVDVAWPKDDTRWGMARFPSGVHRMQNPAAAERVLTDLPQARSIMDVSRALYRATVAHCDGQFARLRTTLERLNLADDTIVVVLSDHGEEFLEHAAWGHSHSLYQELVRVPVLLSYPRGLPAGQRISDRIGLADVTPSLLELAGLPADPDMQAQSFVGLIQRQEATTDPSEPRAFPLSLLSQNVAASKRESLGGAYRPCFEGVVKGSWKAIRNRQDQECVTRFGVEPNRMRSEWELYDLALDPGEQSDRAADHPAMVEQLAAELDKPRSRPQATGEESKSTMDAATRERLRALGYVVDAPTAEPE